MKKFTIITVCLNAEAVIADTITSILEQTCDDYEYLIKDGGSKDHTISIAESFIPAFVRKGISYRIISQADQGIYDAMNQAVREARGEWVLFMNAGDLMADDSVLQRVNEEACMDEADIVYGDAIDKINNLYLRAKARELTWMRFEMPFCHQSCFTRRELLAENPFSTEYKICSDNHFFLYRYQEGKKFSYIPVTMSVYDRSGISSNTKLMTQEMISILEGNPVRDEEAIQFMKDRMKSIRHADFMHRIIWRFIPERIRIMRRLRLRRKRGWKTAEEMFGSGEKEL